MLFLSKALWTRWFEVSRIILGIRDTNTQTELLKGQRSQPWQVCGHLSSCWKCHISKQTNSPQCCAQSRLTPGNGVTGGQRVLWNSSQMTSLPTGKHAWNVGERITLNGNVPLLVPALIWRQTQKPAACKCIKWLIPHHQMRSGWILLVLEGETWNVACLLAARRSASRLVTPDRRSTCFLHGLLNRLNQLTWF